MEHDEAAIRSRFSTDSNRVEAFSDGVMAVIITVMVLELKPPHLTTLNPCGMPDGVGPRPTAARSVIL